MKKTLFILFMLCIQQVQSQNAYINYPVYNGNDLGLTYTATLSVYKVWLPFADKAEMILYKQGNGGIAFKTIAMIKKDDGVWQANLEGDFKGFFYTVRSSSNGKWSNEVADPYAKSVGANGKRGCIIDFKESNPTEWNKDISPNFSNKNLPTDAIIYELHIRDASIHISSNIKNKGKFLGLAEENTTTQNGVATGLSHLKELGVTHIHLLPFFDYNSVDETNSQPQYNWGYDPLNYNVPEGSYSTDASDAASRVKELKTMVAAFHKNGLRVVMDVVYNHVANAKASSFEQLVPGYYFRHKADGSFSDATACGNEVASEMPMMQKFMVESVLYWVNEYHIDGFRFDLMGVHDIETINKISTELRKVKPDILLYGEGWTAGASPLSDTQRALKINAAKLDKVAVFSDDIRDAIKGSVFDEKDKGFVSGKSGMEESIKFGVVAACYHPQIDFKKVIYAKKPFAAEPCNTISYCECHDNHTLHDKLKISSPNATEDELKQMHLLALSIVLTSQGIAFLHAGTDFLRDKKGIENSYNSSDAVNAIDWSLKEKNKDAFEYVKKLIAIKKQHPAFRLSTAKEIQDNITFNNKAPEGTVMFSIDGASVKDSWKKIIVVYNSNKNAVTIDLPQGIWHNGLSNNNASSLQQTANVKAIGMMLLYQ